MDPRPKNGADPRFRCLVGGSSATSSTAKPPANPEPGPGRHRRPHPSPRLPGQPRSRNPGLRPTPRRPTIRSQPIEVSPAGDVRAVRLSCRVLDPVLPRNSWPCSGLAPSVRKAGWNPHSGGLRCRVPADSPASAAPSHPTGCSGPHRIRPGCTGVRNAARAKQLLFLGSLSRVPARHSAWSPHGRRLLTETGFAVPAAGNGTRRERPSSWRWIAKAGGERGGPAGLRDVAGAATGKDGVQPGAHRLGPRQVRRPTPPRKASSPASREDAIQPARAPSHPRPQAAPRPRRRRPTVSA